MTNDKVYIVTNSATIAKDMKSCLSCDIFIYPICVSLIADVYVNNFHWRTCSNFSLFLLLLLLLLNRFEEIEEKCNQAQNV